MYSCEEDVTTMKERNYGYARDARKSVFFQEECWEKTRVFNTNGEMEIVA